MDSSIILSSCHRFRNNDSSPVGSRPAGKDPRFKFLKVRKAYGRGLIFYDPGPVPDSFFVLCREKSRGI